MNSTQQLSEFDHLQVRSIIKPRELVGDEHPAADIVFDAVFEDLLSQGRPADSANWFAALDAVDRSKEKFGAFRERHNIADRRIECEPEDRNTRYLARSSLPASSRAPSSWALF